MRFTIAAETDVGISKKTNQDSYCIKRAELDGRQAAMAVVCDGMGGLKNGELASAAVVRACSKWFEQELPELLYLGDWKAVKQSITALLKKLNERIQEKAASTGGQMGTTACGLLLYEDKYMIINVGDSRVYSLSDKLRLLTEDQSYVMREVSRGTITLEEAARHPRRNLLLQCVGAVRTVVPDVQMGTIEAGMNFLLCSDGFHHELNEREIMAKIGPGTADRKNDMKENLRQLVETAMRRGERDNITAILVSTRM